MRLWRTGNAGIHHHYRCKWVFGLSSLVFVLGESTLENTSFVSDNSLKIARYSLLYGPVALLAVFDRFPVCGIFWRGVILADSGLVAGVLNGFCGCGELVIGAGHFCLFSLFSVTSLLFFR